jgi:hypothetical protein
MTKESNPLVAIKAYCLHQCCWGVRKNWKDCKSATCAIHPFRLGVNPYRKKRVMDHETTMKMRAVAASARAMKAKKETEE